MAIKRKSLLIWLVLLLLVSSVYAWWQTTKPDARTDRTTQEEPVDSDSDPTPPPASDEPTLVQPPNQDNTPPPPPPPAAPTKKQISVTMTTPVDGADYQGNEPVRVRAYIEDATSGTCILKFTKDGAKTVRKTAPLVRSTSYYYCDGWNVARSEFKSSGNWQVNVSFTSDTAEGKSEIRTITLK